MQSYRLDEQVGYILRLASQRHAGIFQRAPVHGLTARQFAALIRLDENGACSQNQLGRLSAMDAATIKGVVDRLAKKGLVQLAPDSSDKRRTIISLSEKAQAILPDLQAVGRQITADTLAPLTLKEREMILKLLDKLC